MLASIATVLLFAAQLFLLFSGADYFGKYWNPLLLFMVSMALPLPYFWQGKNASGSALGRPGVKWIAICIAAAGLTYCGWLLHAAFHKIPEPEKYSDVLPQINALYERAMRGEQPYYRVWLFGAEGPFPVYMPLHWLPIGISKILGLDIRWMGFFPLVIAVLVYVWKTARSWGAVISAILPAVVLYVFIKCADQDMMVTLEDLIAGYYLLLAAGLAARNLPLVIMGIVGCLLSRYTVVFWLPLFGLLLWKYRPWRNSMNTWGITAISVLLIYVLPFWIRQPSILKEGIAYHNFCAVNEWRGIGNPPISWTHENGISFAGNMKSILPGDATHQVFLARMLQAALMIGLVAFGVLYYRRVKTRMSVYGFSLIMLYYTLCLFYLFSPLCFRYYWIAPVMLSAVLCGEVLNRAFAVHGTKLPSRPSSALRTV